MSENGVSWVYSFPGIKCCYTQIGGKEPAEAPVIRRPNGLTCANNNPGEFRCQCLTSTAKMPGSSEAKGAKT